VKPIAFTVPDMRDMDGILLTEPRTPQMEFTMKLPCAAPAYSMLRRAVELSAT